MNLLAHFYLAGDSIPLQIGNFIADFVKGKQQFEQFDESIQKGILLHRSIDTFTDTHEIVKQSKQRLFPTYRHYSAVIMDIVYDHFLAKNFEKYHYLPLEVYTKNIYTNLQDHVSIFPEKTQFLYENMRKYDWLAQYQYIDGLHQSLSSMARRTIFESNMEYAIQDIQKDYLLYEKEFESFFQELIEFCENEKRHLN